MMGKMRRIIRKIRSGQGLVEFALVLPILLAITFGIIEMGRLMFIYAAVATSSREAVRFGSAAGTAGVTPQYYDCDGIRNAAMVLGGLTGVEEDDVIITYDDGTSGTFVGDDDGDSDVDDLVYDGYDGCDQLAASPIDITTGDRIVVTVNYEYAPLVRFFALEAIPPFNLSLIHI